MATALRPKDDDVVTYCEMLAFGNPIEMEMPYSEAIKRYDMKLKALKMYPGLASDMSFIGIKKGKDWIVKND